MRPHEENILGFSSSLPLMLKEHKLHNLRYSQFG